jgi:hypothetical protein
VRSDGSLAAPAPPIPPKKEERLLPASSVHHTQEGWVSENSINRKLGRIGSERHLRAGVSYCLLILMCLVRLDPLRVV